MTCASFACVFQVYNSGTFRNNELYLLVISSQCAIQDNVGTKRTDAVVFGSVGQCCPVAENSFMPCPFRFHNSKWVALPVL